MKALYWTRHTQECVDFLDDMLKPDGVPELVRAERRLLPQSDGRECWQLTLWLGKYLPASAGKVGP